MTSSVCATRASSRVATVSPSTSTLTRSPNGSSAGSSGEDDRVIDQTSPSASTPSYDPLSGAAEATSMVPVASAVKTALAPQPVKRAVIVAARFGESPVTRRSRGSAHSILSVGAGDPEATSKKVMAGTDAVGGGAVVAPTPPPSPQPRRIEADASDIERADLRMTRVRSKARAAADRGPSRRIGAPCKS